MDIKDMLVCEDTNRFQSFRDWEIQHEAVKRAAEYNSSKCKKRMKKIEKQDRVITVIIAHLVGICAFLLTMSILREVM